MPCQPSEHHESQCVLLELTWGTIADAVRLQCQKYSRHWAYAWIEERVAKIQADGRISRIADLGGGGIDSHFADRLSRYADEIQIVDKFGNDGETKGNIRQIVCDMEKGLSVLTDASVDIIVSASALEHLSVEGQREVFREIARVLKPHGYFCGTVSYITRLTDHVIALIKADPVFRDLGCDIFGAVDVRDNLVCAGIRSLDGIDPSRFPGFSDFSESTLLEDETLLYDVTGSYGDVRCTKEVDALRLKNFECGIFFQKTPVNTKENTVRL